MIEKQNIRSLSASDLKTFFVEQKEKPFRAKQVFEWLWKKQAVDFDEMTNLSLATRNLLML